MAGGPKPLRLALRASLQERDVSIRQFARMCHDASPEQSFETWLRLVSRILEPGSTRTVNRAKAELWARILDQPADYFVRQPERKSARERALENEVDALEAEKARLEAEVAEFRRRLGEDAAQGGGGTLP